MPSNIKNRIKNFGISSFSRTKRNNELSGGDFETTKKSRLRRRDFFVLLVLSEGIEPPSLVPPPATLCPLQDSNLQPFGPKPNALSIELRGRVRRAGKTSALSVELRERSEVPFLSLISTYPNFCSLMSCLNCKK